MDAWFTFARATVADTPAIMSLYDASIVPVWDRTGRDYDLKVVHQTLVRYLRDPTRFLYVLRHREDGKLGGYLSWEKHPDHTSQHVIAHLRMLLVHPDFHRQGLARQMMSLFETAALENGCTKVLLDVVVDSPAFDFYKAGGYQHWSNYMEKKL